MKLDRRDALRAGGVLAAFAAPLSLLFDRPAREPATIGKSGRDQKRSLEPDPRGLCDLPHGFTYVVVERAPGLLSDGYQMPYAPDGMACFPGAPGTLVLLRNHELDRIRNLGPFTGTPPAEAYDAGAMGCVTRVVVDARTLRRISSNLVLAGTLRNCAGGASPWGWLSCEESTAMGHGYVFLCRTDAATLQAPTKIAAYGRFNHEAVCIDPNTTDAYLTEDRGDSCLYRFRASSPNTPFEGRLEALAVEGSPRFDTGTDLVRGQRLRVQWVAVDDPDPAEDTVRRQARARGAAMIRRGEGIWFHDDAVYFCATAGGRRGSGQVLCLRLARGGGADTLEVLAESTDTSSLDMPDNITVAPWGDVYMAEDGAGEQYVRCLSRSGRLVDVARNAQSTGEFAGVCFSPSGDTLFVNMQRDAATLAIRGPFESLGA